METQPVIDNNDANTVTERHVMLMYVPLVINLTCIRCSLKLTVLVHVYSSHNNNNNVSISKSIYYILLVLMCFVQ